MGIDSLRNIWYFIIFHRKGEMEMQFQDPRFYDYLQVSPQAEPEIIEAAYRRLAKKYHPDVFQGDKAFAEEQMKRINAAYQVLRDPDARRAYDAWLAGGAAPGGGAGQARPEDMDPALRARYLEWKRAMEMDVRREAASDMRLVVEELLANLLAMRGISFPPEITDLNPRISYVRGLGAIDEAMAADLHTVRIISNKIVHASPCTEADYRRAAGLLEGAVARYLYQMGGAGIPRPEGDLSPRAQPQAQGDRHLGPPALLLAGAQRSAKGGFVGCSHSHRRVRGERVYPRLPALGADLGGHRPVPGGN